MLQDIVIVSAGRFGREVHAWVEDAISAGQPWRIKGFLDDRTHALNRFGYSTPIISTVEEYVPSSDELFLCAIGDPLIRKRYCESLQNRGARFATLIHPSAVIGAHVRLGAGVIIAPCAVLTVDLTIGDFAYIGPHTLCSHDSQIGKGAQISGHCT